MSLKYDISLYFKDQIVHLRQRHLFRLDWPSEAAIKQLIKRAVPLFIIAVTLYRFVSNANWNP
ncbi:WD domain-containing protein [Penicillium psychrosexuale]|uniref:WD domain-containing protein n=1 Tax=Penicillium psychrosexuale TaxID=1002107 RepID=UPI0025450941|nr:WD domain-containing protein [Penicillium psychrosexuale]KAJ5796215.1 WD domain-containing protein [Penicillium psychrosexuale]